MPPSKPGPRHPRPTPSRAHLTAASRFQHNPPPRDARRRRPRAIHHLLGLIPKAAIARNSSVAEGSLQTTNYKLWKKTRVGWQAHTYMQAEEAQDARPPTDQPTHTPEPEEEEGGSENTWSEEKKSREKKTGIKNHHHENPKTHTCASYHPASRDPHNKIQRGTETEPLKKGMGVGGWPAGGAH